MLFRIVSSTDERPCMNAPCSQCGTFFADFCRQYYVTERLQLEELQRRLFGAQQPSTLRQPHTPHLCRAGLMLAATAAELPMPSTSLLQSPPIQVQDDGAREGPQGKWRK